MKISKEEKEEFDNFIGTFKLELEQSDSFETTLNIYKNAIERLDEMDLIPKNIDVKKLQNIITDNFQIRLLKYLHSINFPSTFNGKYENLICLISGDFGWFFLDHQPIRSLFFELTGFWMGHLIFGYYSLAEGGIVPSNGWIHTEGLLGKWTYEGKFIGDLYEFRVTTRDAFFFGAVGFIGKLFRIGDLITIGFVTSVKIQPIIIEPNII